MRDSALHTTTIVMVKHGDDGNDADNRWEDHDDHHNIDDNCNNNDDNDADHDGADDRGWLTLNSEKNAFGWPSFDATRILRGFVPRSFLPGRPG